MLFTEYSRHTGRLSSGTNKIVPLPAAPAVFKSVKNNMQHIKESNFLNIGKILSGYI